MKGNRVEMKFSQLNPCMWGNSHLPGVGTVNELVFDCPVCGPPYKIRIYCHQGPADESKHLWHWENMPGVYDWDAITIKPSISSHDHGKKKTCSAHFSITNGQIV